MKRMGAAMSRGSNVTTALALEGSERIVEVPTAALSEAPWQPRTDDDTEELETLMESVRQHGVLEPLLARDVGGGGLQLVAGHRRWTAAKRLGLRTVPVRLLRVSETDAKAITLVENLARQDLTAFDTARGLHSLRETLISGGRPGTLEEVAGLVGRSPAYVSEHLAIARAFGGKEPRLHGVKKLPKVALLLAARAPNAAKRDELLKRALGQGGGPLKRRPKTGRPKEAAVLVVRQDGRASLQLRVPAADVPRDKARDILARIEPVLSGLRKAAK